MKIIFFFVCFFLGQNVYSQKQTSIFNGKNLTGWTVHGTEKWYIQNGELICESGPDKQFGYLSTNKSYKNFELTLEFKQEANGNSGVCFHSSIDGIKITGWKCEIAPIGHHTGGIYEFYGRGWLRHPPAENEKYLKTGEWNKLKLRVVGDQVTTWLNDHIMVDMKDEKFSTRNGFIALQIHDGGGIKVRWKKIMIKELN